VPNFWKWRHADKALAWLILLATLSAWLALTFSTTSGESTLALVVTICRRSIAETIAHGAELGRLSLLLPLGIGIVLTIAEALQLILATRRWMVLLAESRCTPNRKLQGLAKTCNLAGKITLIRAQQPFVFTQGLIRPRVWLSTGLLRQLARDELEAVLRHEAHHGVSHDPLKMLIANCLSRGLFFVPISRDLCQEYIVAKEIAADAYATQSMRDALPLARALRKLISIPLPSSAPARTLVSGLSVTEVRLLSLLNPSRSQRSFQLKHLGLSLFWLLLLAGVLLAPAANHLPSVSECAPHVAWIAGSRL